MKDRKLIRVLHGDSASGCSCYANSSGECGCGVMWPEDVASQAADRIAELAKALRTMKEQFNKADRDSYWSAGNVEVPQMKWTALGEAIEAAEKTLND